MPKFAFTRRHGLLSLLAAGCLVALIVAGFNLPMSDIWSAVLVSVLVVILIAIPAGLTVALAKGINKILQDRKKRTK